MVYCKIGLMTRTSAGSTPANRRPGPSSRMILRKVDTVFGLPFFSTSTSPTFRGSSDSDLRAVMRVFTTQMGLVMRTVAEPARAPAAMDSRVLRRDF